MYDIIQLNDMLVPELKDVAEKLQIKGYKKLNKKDIIFSILDKQAEAPELVKAMKDSSPSKVESLVENAASELKKPKRKRVAKKEPVSSSDKSGAKK